MIRMNDIAYEAMIFAMECHKDQLRKYIDVPYFSHLAEVAGLLATVRNDPESIAVAWLHDCMEDCGVDFTLLAEKFSPKIAQGVYCLSDLDEGNRAYRKQLSRDRISKCDGWIQDIKVCDLISNTPSIVKYDPKFAVTYLREKALMLHVLDKANSKLLNIAWGMISPWGIKWDD